MYLTDTSGIFHPFDASWPVLIVATAPGAQEKSRPRKTTRSAELASPTTPKSPVCVAANPTDGRA